MTGGSGVAPPGTQGDGHDEHARGGPRRGADDRRTVGVRWSTRCSPERRPHLAVYEGRPQPGMRVVDTRHEQTASFAAEAYAKLTRTPGLAALTAGPGITNGVSAITSAHFNGSPLVVLGGRAPQLRWGAGSLQEFDHVPVVASITKSAQTVTDPTQAGDSCTRPRVSRSPRTVGRSSWTSRSTSSGGVRRRPPGRRVRRTRHRARRRGGRHARCDDRDSGAARLHRRQRRLLGRCLERTACGCRALRVAVLLHGLVAAPSRRPRTRLPAHTRAPEGTRRPGRGVRHPARLPAGLSGRSATPRVAHVVDAPSQRAGHVDVHTVAGDAPCSCSRPSPSTAGTVATHDGWIAELRGRRDPWCRQRRRAARRRSDPIKPSRIYGELGKRLERDAVGDLRRRRLRQLRRKFVEVFQAGCWLDTGPTAARERARLCDRSPCRRPSSQVVCCWATARRASA